MRRQNVLFLCTGNSARSQLGEALLRHHAGDRFAVHSAGTEPKGVHPLTPAVLEEVGVSADGLRSKGVKEFLGRLPVRYLIIVCSQADSACPTLWPGVTERLYWPFDDPASDAGSADAQMQQFRRVRDEINDRIIQWLADLQAARELPEPAARA